LNACVSVGYVATAAAMGIELRGLRIHTAGKLDLRGFLGLDAKVNPGYDGLTMHVDIDADARRRWSRSSTPRSGRRLRTSRT